MAPKEDEEQRSPWAKPAFVLAGAFVLGALVLGLWLALGAGSNHKPNHVGATGTSSSVGTKAHTSTPYATRPPTAIGSNSSQASAGCHVPPGSQQVLTVAPSGITWQLWQGIALPYSKMAGPEVIQGDVARCYAHSPLGALLATVQITSRFVVATDWQPIVYQQILPTAGREIVIKTEEAAAREPNTPSPPGTYSQIAGFSFVTYTPQVVAIDLVERGENGAMAVGTYTVQWSDGDWKVVVQPNGQFTPPVQQVSSLAGYVMWGGV